MAILQILGKAIVEKIADDSAVFASAPINVRGKQALSGRVHLLPYLGYDELYQRFHRGEFLGSTAQQRLAEFTRLTGSMEIPPREAWIGCVGQTGRMRLGELFQGIWAKH